MAETKRDKDGTADAPSSRADDANGEQIEFAEQALRMTQAAEPAERPSSRTADEGMQPLPNLDIAPSGALHAEGHRPVLERSRKVR